MSLLSIALFQFYAAHMQGMSMFLVRGATTTNGASLQKNYILHLSELLT
jgi:hypothetical protein